MQKKRLSMKFSASKLICAWLAAVSLCSCGQKYEGDADFLFDGHQDQLATEAAKYYIGTRLDLMSRTFLARRNLVDYINTHDPIYAQNIEKYYKGYLSLNKELSRNVGPYESRLQVARYLDAGILMFVKNNPAAARKLLDSYCPPEKLASYESKMDCHYENAEHFYSAGAGRSEQETAYLFQLIVGTAYDESPMVGNAMRYKAEYDIDNADKQIGKYLERNAWNDEVMKRYCKPVYLYGTSEYPVDEHEKYAAASRRANCPLYVELAKKEEEEAERAAKHPDTEGAVPAPVSRQ